MVLSRSACSDNCTITFTVCGAIFYQTILSFLSMFVGVRKKGALLARASFDAFLRWSSAAAGGPRGNATLCSAGPPLLQRSLYRWVDKPVLDAGSPSRLSTSCGP